MTERQLNISIRLVENTAANNSLLRGLEQRIKSAVNPPASASNNLANNRLAAQLTFLQEKAAVDLRRIQARSEADEARHQRRMEEIAARGTRNRTNSLLRYSSVVREAGESIQNVGGVVSAVSNRILDFGRAAVRSAVGIDQQVSVLRALTGSAAAAEARFKSLIELSRRTPGLTTSLATSLDAQLRASNVSQANIDKILPTIGRINAVSKLENPQAFASNLVQLVTQNFERSDLKELVGNSPIAGQIIASLFNVDSPTNSKAIREQAKRLGIKTADDFFTKFAEAANRNKGLANATESLGTQFEKLRDRAGVALRPLGLTITNAIIPLIERAIPKVEQLADAFAALPPQTQQTAVAVGALGIAAGPATIALGSLVQTAGALGNLASVVGGAAGLGGAGASMGVFAALVAGAAVESAALYDAYNSNLGGLRSTIETFTTDASRFWQNYGESIKSVSANVAAFLQTNLVNRITGPLKLVSGALAVLNGDFRKGLGNLATGAVEVTKGLPGLLFGIGQQVVAGLVRGMANKTAEVFSTAANLAKAALQASAQALGIASPSKEFIKIGQRVGDGFIAGVQTRKPDIFAFLNQTFLDAAALADRNIKQIASRYATLDSLRAGFSNAQSRGNFAGELQGQRRNDFAGDIRRFSKPPSEPASASPLPFLSGSGKDGAGQKSELARLRDELRDTTREINLLKAATSPEYRVRIKLDAARETRTELENLLQLRRELGQLVAAPIRDVKGETGRLEALRDFNRLNEGRNPLQLVVEAQQQKNQEQQRAYAQLIGIASQGETNLVKLTREQTLARSEEYAAYQKLNPLLAETIRLRAAANDEAEASTARQQAYEGVLGELNSQLQKYDNLSQAQILTDKLKTAALSKLTEAEKENLLVVARQVDARQAQQDARQAQADAISEQKRRIEEAQRSYEQFTGRLEGLFSDAFERGPRAFLDAFLQHTKRTLARVLAEIAAANLSRVFNPASNGSATAGQQSGGGGLLGGLLNAFRPQSAGGGFNLGNLGLGPGGTATFSGAPVNFGSGAATSQVGGFRGFLNQLSGFQLFGARAAAVTPQTIGGLPVLPGVQIPGLSAPAGAPSITGVGTTAASAAAPSLLASLGGAGLLAGGGLLGSLAGGKSPTGRLLGGLGGTLGAGFLGASGVFGAGIQAALPALLSNPITAIVAGGLIGGALLVRAFANRDLEKLSGTIKEVHQLEVPTKGEGLALLKQVKQIGQETYGKRWLDQRADLVKQPTVIDLLTQYAIGTNQSNSPLVKAKRLADPFNEQNNFVRRLNGGLIPGPTLGRDYVPALLDGNEYVSTARTVQREGLASFAALDAGVAKITPNNGGDALATEIRGLRDEFRAMHASLVYELRTVASATSRLGLASPGTVVMAGLHEQPGALDEPLSRAFRSGNLYKFTEDIIGR